MLGPASTPRTLLQTAAAPLFVALGFEPPGQVEAVDAVLAATLRSDGHTVALLVTSWGEALDPFWRLAVTQAARRSAAWCVLFDGLHLRIVDAGRLYARRHLEFDLDLALDDPRSSAALWRTSSSSSLTADPADARSLHALVAASDRHAAGVCRSLREGVLAASAEVLRALLARSVRLPAPRFIEGKPDSADIQNSFEQALTIVYRMLFLLFAEARALVPLWHPIYRESYSLDAPRRRRAFTRVGRLLGYPARHRPPRSRRLPRGRPARDAVQRTALRTRAHAARGAPRSGRRGRAARAGRAVDEARTGSRRTGANRLSRSRRRAARRRLRDVARLRTPRRTDEGNARIRLRHPQGDRHVLHPTADRRLPRAPNARSAGA